MVKFITRTICMALITVLCAGAVNAQYKTKSDKLYAPQSQVVSFSQTNLQLKLVAVTDYSGGAKGQTKVTLKAANVWNDGTGYQLLLDADANTYGTTIPTQNPFYVGNAPASIYNQFEYKIPENADGNLSTSNIITNGNEESIIIPSGTYDYVIVNPDPGYGQIWIASSNGAPSSGNDYVFEENKHYHFSLTLVGENDYVTLTITDQSFGDECPAVTNLKAEVQGTDAVLTWNAAEDSPTGYKVYLNGSSLGTTTELTYTATGLPGGENTLSVEALYNDECTPKKVDVTVKVGNCNGVTNFAVDYNTDCEAVLSWDAAGKSRSEVLWDNTNINVGTGGLISSYWSGNDNYIFTADDFTAESAWTIESVNTQGFSNAPSTLPTKYSISIYSDNGNKPGDELYRNNALSFTGSDVVNIPLSTPFTLPAAGKYWIAIAGAYDASVSTNAEIGSYRWNVYYGATPIGSNYCLKDKMMLINPSDAWGDASTLVPGSYSMYFSIEGEENGGPVETNYNVYRDGNLITTTTETSYTDSGFDTSVGHEWAVAVVCGNGADSKWERIEEGPCDPPTPPCPVVGKISAEFNADCTEASIIWTVPEGENLKYTVKRDGNIICENITENQCKETATEKFDGEYTWTIITICPDGESEPAEVTATAACVGINELENSVSIYPNPATSTVSINAKDYAKVEIYNTVGQLMKTTTETSVDVSSYNTGIYFFRVYDSNNNVVTKRVMVTR